jgi:hypothetical protein
VSQYYGGLQSLFPDSIGFKIESLNPVIRIHIKTLLMRNTPLKGLSREIDLAFDDTYG